MRDGHDVEHSTQRAGLVLWDVDHTLLETGGVGRQLYELAFSEATGQPFAHRAKITGRTELDILADTLALHDLSPSAAVIDAYADALARQYERHVDQLRERGRALPGATQVLSALAAGGFRQTVVTGNLRAVAIIKLRAFGLSTHLDIDIGAFADDDRDRSALVGIAIARARATDPLLGEGVVLIGDTPHDVAAAQRNSVAVIAVASGKASANELEDAGATLVVESLADVNSIVAAVQQLSAAV